MLTAAEFDTYVADGSRVDVVRAVRVGLPDGTAWTWRLEQDMVDPAGKHHAAGGASASVTQAAGHPAIQETGASPWRAKVHLITPPASMSETARSTYGARRVLRASRSWKAAPE